MKKRIWKWIVSFIVIVSCVFLVKNNCYAAEENLCTVTIGGVAKMPTMACDYIEIENESQDIQKITPTNPVAKNYTIQLTPGEYTYRLYYRQTTKGDPKLVYSDKLIISPGETEKTIAKRLVKFQIKLSANDGVVYDQGGYVEVKDANGNVVEHYTDAGVKANGSNGYANMVYMLDQGEKYTYSVKLEDERLEYTGSTSSLTVTKSNMAQTINLVITPIELKKTVQINAQANLHVYKFPEKAYTAMEEISCEKQDSEEAGKELYTFKIIDGTRYMLVAGGEGTPFKKNVYHFQAQGTDKSVSNLELSAEKYETYFRFDEANDLYTNIPNGGYLQMKVGETASVEGFRVLQTVINDTDNMHMEPDMHYEVIAGQGVIKLESAGSVGRLYQNVTALKNGIAVIKITYDDMINWDSATNAAAGVTYFPAIDAMNTGIVIINVGGSSTGIDTGITLTDYDTVYIPHKTVYPDGTESKTTDTTTYTFKPSGNVEVSVHAPINVNADWNSGWKTYTPDADGQYTIDLQEGRNIVRITSGDSVVYDTINAKNLTTTIQNTTRPKKTPQIGDTVSISFDGLEMPVYKMTAIYNPGAENLEDGSLSLSRTWVEYVHGDDTLISEKSQYKVATVNTITYEVTDEQDVALTGGRIYSPHFGRALDGHCNISLDGSGRYDDAPVGTVKYFDILPDITIPVVGKEVGVIDLINEIDTTNYLGCVDKIMAAKDAYDALTDEEKAKVTNADVLNTAYEAVKDIIDVIKAVAALPDEVTLADREAVEAAQAAYAALAPERQAVVSNADKLQKAVEAMQALMARQERIEKVIAQIGALPVTDKLTEEDEKAVQEARAAYEALAEDEKAEVTNVDTLEKAEQQIRYLKEARSVSEKIDAIGDVTIDNFDEKCELIVEARTAYDLLDDAAKELVSNLDTLKKAEEAYKLTDEDVQKVIEAIKALETPLAASKEDMTDEELLTVWNDYSYLVVNIRGLADRLSENQQKIVTNMSDLELAEKYLARAQAATAKKESDAAYAKAKELLSADTLPKASDYEGENPKDLTTADVDAVTAAKAAYDALTEEQQTTLKEEIPDAVANIEAMDKLLKDSESTKDYYETALAQTANKETAEKFMADLADVYATYKDAKVTRSDITVINNTLKQYDALADDVKALLVDAEIDGQKVPDILKTLTGWSEQVAADEKAAQEVSDYIKNLPSSLNMDNMEAVRADLETIVKMYNALNDQAKTYVRRLSKVEAVNKVLNALDAEIKAFKEAKVTVKAGTVTYNAVTLNWNTVEFAKSYEVYRKAANGQWTKLTETTGTSYSDQSVAASTAYGYKVIAVTDRWGQRVESSFVDVTVTTAATPSKPDDGNKPKPDQNVPNLTAVSAGYNSVRLNWSKVEGADGYRIYRATSANGTYKSVATIKNGNITSYTNKKLTTGKTYYYKIRAYKNQNGKKVWKPYSKTVSVIPTLTQVKVTKAGVSNRKAVLKWKKVSGANGYLIYRSTSKNGTYKCVNSLSSKKTKYTSKKLAKGKTYYYKIRAYRKVGGKRVYSPYTAARQVKVK